MSYLQKIGELQDRAEASRNSAREFQNEVRQDAFDTAEARKNDYLGHISRGIEDMTKKFETAGAIAGGTSAIVKSIKKVKEIAAKRARPAGEEEPKPAPEESPTQPAGSERIEMTEFKSTAPTEAPAEAPTTAPTEAGADLGVPFPEVEVSSDQPAPKTAPEETPVGPEEAGGKPLFPEASGASKEELALQEQARGGATFSQESKEQLTQPDIKEDAAPGQEGSAPKPSDVDVGENLSTEGQVLERDEQLNPESMSRQLGNSAGGDIESTLETGGTELAETGGEVAATTLGDVALGAIPIVGDLAMVGSLIGDLVEGLKGSKKEDEASKEMEPEPAQGVAIATTGIDGKSLLEQ